MTEAPIHAAFAVHRLNDVGMMNAKTLARKFTELLVDVEQLCGSVNNGREMAIVKTKLEEASFFAKKAMAVNPNMQEK